MTRRGGNSGFIFWGDGILRGAGNGPRPEKWLRVTVADPWLEHVGQLIREALALRGLNLIIG